MDKDYNDSDIQELAQNIAPLMGAPWTKLPYLVAWMAVYHLEKMGYKKIKE